MKHLKFFNESKEDVCPTCKGKGVTDVIDVEDYKCMDCNGTGKLSKYLEIVNIETAKEELKKGVISILEKHNVPYFHHIYTNIERYSKDESDDIEYVLLSVEIPGTNVGHHISKEFFKELNEKYYDYSLEYRQATVRGELKLQIKQPY